MNLAQLCGIKGIGPAKATVLLAAAEYCKRLQPGIYLKDETACYNYLQPLLAPATQLQYVLLLMTADKQLLAFAEMGRMLPTISRITELALESGARRIVLGRNGWPAFSNMEARCLTDLKNACSALHIICDGMMSVGSEHVKMI